jgi:ankyrin repeat protein
MRGANVNTLYCDYPPLTVAAINHDVKVIRLLLQYGADPNQRDRYGRFPLLFAAGWGKPEEIRELVKYKADINLPMPRGIRH